MKPIVVAIFALAPALAAAQQLNPSESDRRMVEDFIRSQGYVCPAAKNFRYMGSGPRGDIIRVWCGPRGTADLQANLVYRLDQLPSGLSQVSPWEGDPHRRPNR